MNINLGLYLPLDATKNMPALVVEKVEKGLVTWRWRDESKLREVSVGEFMHEIRGYIYSGSGA